MEPQLGGLSKAASKNADDSESDEQPEDSDEQRLAAGPGSPKECSCLFQVSDLAAGSSSTVFGTATGSEDEGSSSEPAEGSGRRCRLNDGSSKGKEAAVTCYAVL